MENWKRDIFEDIKVIVENNLRDYWVEFSTSFSLQQNNIRKSVGKRKSLVTNVTENEINHEFNNVKDPQLARDFLEYLRNNFSSENMELWQSVNEFKNKNAPTKNEAIEIATTWLGYQGAECMVNFENESLLKNLFQALDKDTTTIDKNLFDPIFFECQNLLTTKWTDFCSKKKNHHQAN